VQRSNHPPDVVHNNAPPNSCSASGFLSHQSPIEPLAGFRCKEWAPQPHPLKHFGRSPIARNRLANSISPLAQTSTFLDAVPTSSNQASFAPPFWVYRPVDKTSRAQFPFSPFPGKPCGDSRVSRGPVQGGIQALFPLRSSQGHGYEVPWLRKKRLHIAQDGRPRSRRFPPSSAISCSPLFWRPVLRLGANDGHLALPPSAVESHDHAAPACQ